MNRHILTGLTAVVSAAAGIAVGYFISKKQLEAAYDKRLEQELASTRAHLNNLAKQGLNLRVPGQELDSVTAAETKAETEARANIGAEALRKAVGELRYGPNAPIGDPKPVIQRNVFRDEEEPNEDEEAAWAEEVKNRTPDKPYIIGVEEYGNDLSCHRLNLTYFMMDDTLLDDGEVPIDDAEMVVGESNLDMFGYRSGDPRLIYIRNEKLGADYEVTLHDGSYAEVVLGIVQPRVKRNPPKMRRE